MSARFTVSGIENIVPVVTGKNGHTIGYVSELPAFWTGHLKPGMSYTPIHEGDSIEIDGIEYIVKNHIWI